MNKNLWIICGLEDEILDICTNEDNTEKSSVYWHNKLMDSSWNIEHFEQTKEADVYFREYEIDKNLSNENVKGKYKILKG